MTIMARLLRVVRSAMDKGSRGTGSRTHKLPMTCPSTVASGMLA